MISQLLSNVVFQLATGGLGLYVVVGAVVRTVASRRRRQRVTGSAVGMYRTYPVRPPL
jgi:hypothetical protein